MKRFEKKLSLVKTTVSNLDQQELQSVKGAAGMTNIECPSYVSFCCPRLVTRYSCPTKCNLSN